MKLKNDKDTIWIAAIAPKKHEMVNINSTLFIPVAFKNAKAIGAETPQVPCTKPPSKPIGGASFFAICCDSFFEFFLKDNMTYKTVMMATKSSIILVLVRIKNKVPPKQPKAPKADSLKENVRFSTDRLNCLIWTKLENRLGTAIMATANLASKKTAKTGIAITGLPAPVAPLTKPPSVNATIIIIIVWKSKFIIIFNIL